MTIDDAMRMAGNLDGTSTREAELRETIEALILEERKACAKVCERLRIATGVAFGESDEATEAWNKALQDAEQLILPAAPEAMTEFERDAARYRWMRDGNAYAPEEAEVTGGDALDRLIDDAMPKGKWWR